MADRADRPRDFKPTVESRQEAIRCARVTEELLLQLASETDPNRVINLVAENTARLINSETVAVPMLSADNLKVHYDFVYGRHKDAFLGRVLPIEDAGLCGWVLENRRPILTNDLPEDPRVKKEEAKALGIKAAALAPLISRGRVIGGLSAFNKTDGSPYTEEDLNTLAHFANYAAVTIENARLMAEVRDEKVKLEAILDGVRDGIVFLSKEGKIVNVNKAMERFIPLKADEMLGVDVQDLASFISLSELFDWRSKAAPGRRCWEVVGCNNEECPVYNTDILRCWSFSDNHCFRPDYQKGGEKVLEVCAHCEVYRQAGLKLAAPREVRSMGRVLQATSTLIINEYVREAFGEVMVFHDITAEKQAEQQRSDFVSMITHDLKAPITSILGYCELMAEEQETGKLREMGNAVMRNSNHLLKMINDFLELSKLDAHKVKLNLLGISLGSFLPATVEPYLAQAKERGINISLRVSEDTPEVLADMDQLSRIVGNLISNSLRYVSAGGSISITTSKAGGGFVRIAVEDDGAGIGPEDLPQVFERYYTGKEDRMRGAGLGLAIVKLLTDAHGGAVSVKSEKGAGAEFTVLLPAA